MCSNRIVCASAGPEVCERGSNPGSHRLTAGWGKARDAQASETKSADITVIHIHQGRRFTKLIREKSLKTEVLQTNISDGAAWGQNNLIGGFKPQWRETDFFLGRDYSFTAEAQGGRGR